MKTIIIFIISLIFSVKVQAQSTITTTTVTVKGNCDECKERIENAADIKGVKNAVWNEDKQAMTVTFDTSKVSLDQIEISVAKAGYETANHKADAKAYDKLPKCCRYNHNKHQ